MLPFANKDIHNISQDKFKVIEIPLIKIYEKYANRDQIIVLLRYWLFSIDAMREAYSDKVIPCFAESKESNPLRFSFEYESYKERSLYKFRSFKIPLFVLRMLSKLYLPGSRVKSFYKKVFLRFSIAAILSIPRSQNKKMYLSLTALLRIYFEDLDTNSLNLLFQKIPEFFFSNQININSHQGLKVECAASCFLEFSGLENIFLLSKQIFILGLQHGGGYDAFKVCYFQHYEKSLCNSFFGWGFSEKNITQHRFTQLVNHSHKRLLWLEDCSLPNLYSFLLPMHNILEKNTKVSEFIGSELEEIAYTNLPHPVAASKKYKDFRKNSYELELDMPAEKIIGKNDIVLFDNLASTVIFHCIYFKITFLIVMDEQDLSLLHDDQVRWFYLLKKHNLGFFTDEKGMLKEKILSIMNSDFSVNDEIIDFHNTQFIKSA